MSGRFGARRTTRSGVGALLLAVAAAASHADRIETVSGRVFDGRVVRREPDPERGERLTIRVGAATLVLTADQIRSIRPSTPAEEALIAAQEAFNLNRAAEAVQWLQRAMEGGIDPPRLGAMAREYQDALTSLALTAEPAPCETIGAMSAVLGEAPPPGGEDFRPLAALFEAARGAFDASARILKALGEPSWAAWPTLRERLIRLLIDQADRLLTQGRFEEAVKAADALETLDAAMGGQRRTQIYLQWAAALRRERAYEQAMQIYLRYVMDETPNIARDRMALTLDEAERYYRAQDDLPAAARLLADYGMSQMPEWTRPRLVQVWRDQGWRLLRRGAFAQAREAFGQAERYVEGSARADLQQVEYRERLAALAPEDAVGRFNLGVWCQERSMWAEALEQYRAARALGLDAEHTEPLIRQLEAKLAEEALLRMMDLYQAGEFGEVLAQVNRFRQEAHPPSFLAQARQIEQLAMEAMRVRVAERPQQAEALYRRAERAFDQQQYAECEALLKLLLEQYADTVAAGPARSLYAAVRNKLALAAVEKGLPLTARPADARGDDATTTSSEIDRLIRTLGRMNYR